MRVAVRARDAPRAHRLCRRVRDKGNGRTAELLRFPLARLQGVGSEPLFGDPTNNTSCERAPFSLEAQLLAVPCSSRSPVRLVSLCSRPCPRGFAELRTPVDRALDDLGRRSLALAPKLVPSLRQPTSLLSSSPRPDVSPSPRRRPPSSSAATRPSTSSMSTVAAIPIRPVNGDRHAPVLSTLDPSFSPNSLHLQPWTSPSPLPSTSPSQGYSPSSSPSPPPLGHSPRPAFAVPMGSRCERVPYDGPGTAVYVRQPTRAQLVPLFIVSEMIGAALNLCRRPAARQQLAFRLVESALLLPGSAEQACTFSLLS